ncbi:IMPACT family member YvyE [Insulibacter thermoxylanivorax]|uniref:IMPACT family member YvyE n=1 Tax=Insulibacter thermoxylanivorax TaxID=2749268 RepID=A0A916QI96_9BACL|nr:YigZ family protein [Insulibacter thermoxylanivorax]GFR38971.1 IMPACT family member YvyE [Insulibacter thermoxylanivorax]
MLLSYRTVQGPGEAEIVIKKSRFIGHCRPVATEEEAIQFIEEIKKKHWSATHNCSAYLVGDRDEYQKQSDDGEPSGTAGKPMLEVLKQQGLKYTAVVVTRYFGGTLLGAGGLVRAYTEATVEAVKAAKPVLKVLHREVTVTVDYTWYGKLENELNNRGVITEPPTFTDKVSILCLPEAEEAERFTAWITDLTQGQGIIEQREYRYIEQEI